MTTKHTDLKLLTMFSVESEEFFFKVRPPHFCREPKLLAHHSYQKALYSVTVSTDPCTRPTCNNTNILHVSNVKQKQAYFTNMFIYFPSHLLLMVTSSWTDWHAERIAGLFEIRNFGDHDTCTMVFRSTMPINLAGSKLGDYATSQFRATHSKSAEECL
jgi:hypothetical protein